ncbi:MAG: TRAP transporter large permease subunit [Methylomonas sp.]|jgi:TRAP-type C4-dicarboxylate transport system permease large subunit|uniref:TRAP transporter large permease n=1 Tax=Methylomonas sp. TaxID=418 RepID=UPI0025EEC941|nr:TRAP transporter large permease subunit [Methylomonas sp.]MCK9605281.1 TRAP transporter large permease subunit [Methylomonas sp.]
MTFALALLLVVMLLLGAPLFAVILAATMLGFYSAGIDFTVIAAELYRIANTPLLVALPLFTLAGYVLSECNTSERLLRLTRAWFGWMPFGLAIISLLTCAAFTAFTGASGVTIIALGALLLPVLVKEGYQSKFSLGLVTTSGSLGLLLPPSVPLILYGIIVQQLDIGEKFTLPQLFLAGFLPCLLMIALLIAWAIWANRGVKLDQTPFTWPEAIASIKAIAWELPLPLFIMVGIFGGYLAISEVAAATALYVLVIEGFIYKEIQLANLTKIISDAMQMLGGILLILGVSMAFTNYLIDAEVPMHLFGWVKEHVNDKLSFLLLLNLFLLVLGAILDIFSALVIVVPLIVPIAVSYGIHPIHLGIIFLANMQIGYLTPPVGMNLFIASYRFNKSITELYQATLPFMLILLVAVFIITYIPWLSLWFLAP